MCEFGGEEFEVKTLQECNFHRGPSENKNLPLVSKVSHASQTNIRAIIKALPKLKELILRLLFSSFSSSKSRNLAASCGSPILNTCQWESEERMVSNPFKGCAAGSGARWWPPTKITLRSVILEDRLSA